MKYLKTTTKPCIYLITNLINQKRYVGQTVRLKERMWEHEKDLRDKSAINEAIRKYGTDNFTVDILEECDDKNLLNEKEIYWIEKLNTYHTEYNLTKGGDGNGRKPFAHAVIQYSYDYKTIIKTYDSLNEAGLAMNGTYVTIRACCLNSNGHGGQVLHAYGYGWSTQDITLEELTYRQNEVDKTAFYAYEVDSNKNIIIDTEKLYYIQAEAIKELQIPEGSIKNILRGSTKTTGAKNGKRYTFRWKRQ